MVCKIGLSTEEDGEIGVWAILHNHMHYIVEGFWLL